MFILSADVYFCSFSKQSEAVENVVLVQPAKLRQTVENVIIAW